MNKKTLYIILTVVIAIIVMILAVLSIWWLTKGKHKKKRYACINGKCVSSETGIYLDKNCGGQCNIPPSELKLSFTPFGTNTCTGSKCPPDSEINPGFYKICWLRLGSLPILQTCNRTKLIDAIIDNYNCLSPSLDLDLNLEGKITVKSDNQEMIYFVDLCNEITQKAIQKGKLVVTTPSLIGGELLKYYNNAQHTTYFNDLYNILIKLFDPMFIKGIVYDTEFWDDNDDKKGSGNPNCDKHGPGDHSNHFACVNKYMGPYFKIIAEKWAVLRPDWEVHINDYPNQETINVQSFYDSINNSPNLGFQAQDYWHCSDANNIMKILVKNLSSGAKKLTWGFAGYKQDNSNWKKSNFEQCVNEAKRAGYYGIFVFGGLCFLLNNSIILCSGISKCPH